MYIFEKKYRIDYLRGRLVTCLQTKNISHIFVYQVFNIYTANGSVISRPVASSKPGSEIGATTAEGNISGQIAHTGQTGLTGAHKGVEVEASSHVGKIRGSFSYNPEKPFYIFPGSSSNVHIRATHHQFLDQRGYARVSKLKEKVQT